MPPRRSLRAARQTKLDFSSKPNPKPTRPLEISSDESPARPTKKRRLDLLQETQRGMKLGSPAKKNPLGMFGSSDNEVSSGDSDSSEIGEKNEPPSKKSRPLSQREPVRAPRKERNKVFVVPQETNSESDEEVIPRSSRRAAAKKALAIRSPMKAKRQQQVSEAEEEEDSDDEIAPRSTRKTNVQNLPIRSPAKRKSKQSTKALQLLTETEEEEVAPRSSRRQGSRKLTIRSPAKRRQRSPTPEVVEEEDSDEEDIPRSTQRRRAPKPLVLDPEEQADLADDLEFLQSSPPASKDGLRSRHTKPLTQREKALEALKRRRASSGGEPSSSATPGRKRAIVLSDTDDELEVIKEEESDDLEDVDGELEEDEDDEYGEEDEDEEAPSGNNVLNMFHEDMNDAGFIDDDGPIGVPADLAAIPIEFSSISRAKPKELFKHAVEWMVHKKINPAFPRTDEIYGLAFRKLDDEVQGLANSKFSSAAWTPDFTRALRARPDILLNEIGSHMRAVMSPHCEACNRKTHPASWEISLTGKPYNKDTLEPLHEDSDSSSSSDSDSDSSVSSADSEINLNGERPTYDATGEQLPPESKIFTVGSTCKANAQMAHTLHHWRYHLNSWVVDYLVREGHCSPEKVVERDSWREKKKQKYANKIVDKMEKEGEIKSLHKLYKNQVDYAFEAKNEHRQGWGRRG